MEKEPYIKIIIKEPGYGINDNVQLFVDGKKVDKMTFLTLSAYVGERITGVYSTIDIEKTKELMEQTENFKTI